MEQLLQALANSGYDANTVKDDLSDKSPMTVNFALFVSRIASEIGTLLETEERVNPPDSAEDAGLSSWKMEVSSFLKELQCPLTFLYEGSLETRLNTSNHRLTLVDFLLSELLSARMEKLDQTPTLEAG